MLGPLGFGFRRFLGALPKPFLAEPLFPNLLLGMVALLPDLNTRVQTRVKRGQTLPQVVGSGIIGAVKPGLSGPPVRPSASR